MTLDLLDIIQAMSNHYHEHYDAIVNWSWKLFCRQWARMIEQATAREAMDHKRKDAQERERGMDAVANERRRLFGGG